MNQRNGNLSGARVRIESAELRVEYLVARSLLLLYDECRSAGPGGNSGRRRAQHRARAEPKAGLIPGVRLATLRNMVIVLRPWRTDDAAALRDALRTTPELRMQFGEADLSTDDRAEAFIHEVLTSTDQRRNWVIDERGAVVGNVGLSAIEFRHGTAWASYWLRADAQGKGHATRSLASVAEWGFKQGLFRLELGHRTNNTASCRVAGRAGFLPEGVERQKQRHGDQRFDVELHARLESDPGPISFDPVSMLSS